MNDLKKSIEFTENLLEEKVQKCQEKAEQLMNKVGKYMNGSWILNMRITPRGKTSGSMALRKKTDKVGRIVKLKK